MRQRFVFTFVFFLCCFCFSAARANSWDDLEENNSSLDRAEIERRNPINAGVVSLEKWENHTSFQMFGLFRYTNFPSYRSWLFPPVYHMESKIDSRSRTSIFPLFYHENDRETTTFWSPMFFYKTGSYLIAPPLYASFFNGETKTSSGLLHFARRDSNHDFFWLGPYVSSRTQLSASHFLFPLYADWGNGSESGEILLPFYFSFADRFEKFSVNLALLAFHRKEERFPVSLSTSKGELYLDADYSWMHSLVRISTRVPVTGYSSEEAPQGVVFNKDSLISRELSRSFYGIDVLFGTLSFEISESRRHLHIFPLTWITWDKNTNDGLLFIPGAFFSYRQNQQEYFALFPAFLPLYARQTDGKSHGESYLGFLFFNKYTDETKESSTGVLWPLFLKKDSPEASSLHLLPFFRTVSWNEKGLEHSRTLSPLFYLSSEVGISEKRGTNFFFPFVYYGYKKTSGLDSMTLLCPGLYVSFENDHSLVSVLPGLYTYESNLTEDYSRHSLLFGLFSKSASRSESSFRVLPFYGRSVARTEREVRTVQYSPLFYISQLENTTEEKIEDLTIVTPLFYSAFRADAKTFDSAFILPVPFYYRHSNNDGLHRNWLGIFDLQEDAGGRVNRFIAAPVFAYIETNQSTLTYVVPFIFETQKFRVGACGIGFVFVFYSECGKTKTLWAGNLAVSENRQTHESFALFFPLLYMKKTPDEVRGYMPGFTYHRTPGEEEYSMLFRVLGGYHESAVERNLNILWYYQEDRGHAQISTLLPLWWYSKDLDTGNFILPLLLSGSFTDSSSTLTLAGAGILWAGYESRDEKTRSEFVLGGLVYQNIEKSPGQKSRGSLWGLLWQYDTDAGERRSELSFGKILYSRTNIEGRSRQTLFGMEI